MPLPDPLILHYYIMRNLFRLVLLIVLTGASPAHASAQRVVDVSYAADNKGNYVFTAFNHAFCTYIVKVDFSSFDNVKADRTLPYRAEVKPGINKLFTLSAIDPVTAVKFNYGSGFTKGCLEARPDTSFTYLLPVKPGKEVQAYEMQSQAGKNSPGSPDNHWYSIRLKMKPGDTIYASRAGVVTEVSVADTANDNGQPLKTENYVEVVHSDCSYGQYSILRHNGALVIPGLKVKMGDPIGIVGGDQYGRGSEIRFSVSYHKEEIISGDGSGKIVGYMNYLPLQFRVKDAGRIKIKNGAVYVAEAPAGIRSQEKTKQTPTSTKAKKIPAQTPAKPAAKKSK